MSSLTGQKIKDTYQSLLKTDDNGLITTVLKNVTDGDGSTSGLYIKDDGILVSGSLTVSGSVDISGSLTVNTINVGQNTINFIDENKNIVNSLSVASGSTNIVISTGSLQSVSGSYFSGSFTGSLDGTASYALTASYVLNGGGGGGGGETIFAKNRTIEPTTTITQYQSLFNPANLSVQDSTIFIVEQDAEYYVLGDLYNSGSIIVSGTIHIDGGLYNSGSIVGPGIIE